MEAAPSSPEPGSPDPDSEPPLRGRTLLRNLPKRRLVWWLLKDTVSSCMQHRILGLAAEAAFFTLLSLPPLLLGLVGLLGYLDAWIGVDTIDSLRSNILDASGKVLSERGVNQLAKPLIDDVVQGGAPDVISFSFALALWSGSRAVNVFIDTITVMYGLDGHRNIFVTRLLAFALYVVALVIGAVALPLMVVGPNALVSWLPQLGLAVRLFYWPVVLLLSIAFLTTLYHVSVPVRSPWREDIPGALVAVLMWVLGSFLLRIYLAKTVEGPTIYGSLAAPVAVLLWIGISAFAVLVGAAVNAAFDRVWPSAATAAARRVNERAREDAVARMVARAAARRERHADGGGGSHGLSTEDGARSDGARSGQRAGAGTQAGTEAEPPGRGTGDPPDEDRSGTERTGTERTGADRPGVDASGVDASGADPGRAPADPGRAPAGPPEDVGPPGETGPPEDVGRPESERRPDSAGPPDDDTGPPGRAG